MKLKWQREYDGRGKLTAWLTQHGKYIVRVYREYEEYIVSVYREYEGWRTVWTLAIDDSTTPPGEHVVFHTGYEHAWQAKGYVPEFLLRLRAGEKL